jgi:ligand-binding SRPBCC domain-containing protein
MRNFSITVDIAAPPERVWQVMIDVDHWHEMTASVSSVKRLNNGPFAVGTLILIKQPKFPPALWRITEILAGKSFTWTSTGPGLKVIATHRVDPTIVGTQVTLTLEYHGVVGGVFARMTSGITERYMAMEAAGLKKRSEGAIRTLAR